jgi:cytidylate kinase
MGYRAVALSQMDGTGSEAIGREAARKLGFGYLNEAIIAQVAQDHGMDADTVAEAERRKSFFLRVAEAAAYVTAVPVPPDPRVHEPDQTDMLLSLIRDTVQDAAERGSVVLAAHAACYACADRSDVLRVWVTAPPATRVSRVVAGGLSDKDAARWLDRSDAGRASYLKRVYGVSGESPADYDVVINTERLAPHEAVGLITGLVRRPADG